MSNWHDHVFFGLHYDLHANAHDTVLGAELTPEHLRERLERVRPDWIQCDCKGHPGYTSWPTQIGSTSPGVIQDALRIHRDVTRELGIRLGMHYSGVWDSRAIELHPDWARQDERDRPDPNATCPLSDYTEHLLIPQMLEIIERYDVDGFWVDGENWASRPCWCPRCRAEFTRRTGWKQIPRRPTARHWAEWLAFHRDLFVEHVTRYADAVHARKPDCLVCSNWMYTIRQPDPVRAPVDYFSGDYDWNWGGDRAAVEGRLLDGRTHLPDGTSWDLMAWGFTKTGDMHGPMPWMMKPLPHLCQEVAEVIALGGAVMVYNTPQRTGWLTGWQQDILAQVGHFCRARQATCFQTRTVPQAAILHLADHYYAHNSPLFNYGTAVQPVEGALHALLETHRSADMLTAEGALARMGEYPLVIIPEQTHLSRDIRQALQQYAQNGGHVLISGAHLATECPQLVGAAVAGPPPTQTTWLPVGEQAVATYGHWQPVMPEPGVEAWGRRLAQTEPGKDQTDHIVITHRQVGAGSITAIHGPVFENYFQGHYPLLRRFIADLIARLDVTWLAQIVSPASPRLEIILRKRDYTLLINLINRGAGEALSPRRTMVQELPPIENITLQVRTAAPPHTVNLAPAGLPLAWQHTDGILTIQVSRVEIHEVIVVEPVG